MGENPLWHMVWHPLGAVGRYLHRSCGLQHPSVSLSIPQHPSSLHILLTLVNACMRLLWLRTPGSCQRKIYPVEEVMPSSFSWAQRGTCLCFSPQRCKPGPGRRCSSLGGRVPGDGAATRVRREERLLPERFSQLFHPCFVLFPCSRDEVLYLGGGGGGRWGEIFAVRSAQRSLASPSHGFLKLQPVPGSGESRGGRKGGGAKQRAFCGSAYIFPS